MKLHKLLMIDSYWLVNKQIARKTSIEASVFLAELLYRYDYFDKRKMLTTIDGEEYFFATADDIEERTTLSIYNQNKAIEMLEKLGILKTIKHGAPRTKHFCINEAALYKVLTGDEKVVKEKEVESKPQQIEVKIKEEKEFSKEVEDLAKVWEEDIVAHQNKYQLKWFAKIDDKLRFAWKDGFDKLIRIDGKQVGEIHNLIRWIRKDYFPDKAGWKGWSEQVRSVSKLREKDKQGTVYYDKILIHSKGGVQSKKSGHTFTPEEIKLINKMKNR